MNKSIKVFAPATIGNACCGFDVLGFAINKPGDIVSLTLTNKPEINITVLGNNKIPSDPKKNTCGVAASEFLSHFAPNKGLDITLEKILPISSGLGSSAAGAAATLFGLNLLFDNICDDLKLLEFGLSAEEAACGAKLADNIAPSLFGGFILINSYSPLSIKKINSPKNLFCTVVHPDIEINTFDARNILPTEIPIQTTIKQMGYLSGFIAALYTADYKLMHNSLHDLLAEPHRSKLIPNFDKAMAVIKNNQGIGGGISGSGPTMFALSKSNKTAEKIGLNWKELYKNIGCQVYVSKINNNGPIVIE